MKPQHYYLIEKVGAVAGFPNSPGTHFTDFPSSEGARTDCFDSTPDHLETKRRVFQFGDRGNDARCRQITVRAAVLSYWLGPAEEEIAKLGPQWMKSFVTASTDAIDLTLCTNNPRYKR